MHLKHLMKQPKFIIQQNAIFNLARVGSASSSAFSFQKHHHIIIQSRMYESSIRECLILVITTFSESIVKLHLSTVFSQLNGGVANTFKREYLFVLFMLK
jgi:hypothetical protein